MRTERQPPADADVLVLTAATALAVGIGTTWLRTVAIALAAALLLARRQPRSVLVVGAALLLPVAGASRAAQADAALAPDHLGPFEGWATIIDDPQPYGASTRVILEVDGERFESWQRGRAARLRADAWRAGERVRLSGARTELDAERSSRVAWQHVVGEFDLEWASDVDPGRPVDRASNRVRAAIERAAAVLPADDGALFRGLVVGDDRDQPREMVERFRNSGLSHLTAVSGQNVAFVLAAAGPLLVRLRPGWRWFVTVGLIAWFVSLTRFEPSIVRAGAMAGLSATAFVLGRQRSPFRLLCWAVTALLLVDPLLVRSIGFWLSVGATGGVATIGPWLAGRLGRLGALATPVGITLGAQAGVVVPALLVFGRLPVTSLPANLLAVPVAGFVMLYGLPAGLIAGWCPPIATVVMFPCRVGVRWVDTVATLADRLEPTGPMAAVGWAVLVGATTAIVALGGTPASERGSDGETEH